MIRRQRGSSTATQQHYAPGLGQSSAFQIHLSNIVCKTELSGGEKQGAECALQSTF